MSFLTSGNASTDLELVQIEEKYAKNISKFFPLVENFL